MGVNTQYGKIRGIGGVGRFGGRVGSMGSNIGGLVSALSAANPLTLGLLMFGGEAVLKGIGNFVQTQQDRRWYKQQMPRYWDRVNTVEESFDARNKMWIALADRLGYGDIARMGSDIYKTGR